MIPTEPNNGCCGHCKGEPDHGLRTAGFGRFESLARLSRLHEFRQWLRLGCDGALAMTGSVEASIRYVVAGEKAIFYPADRERSYWPVEEHRVSIADMRARADER